MSSDQFFEDFNEKYDIIFIDGWHSEAQVDRDTAGALSHLNEGGTVVLHDTEPRRESAAKNIPPGPVVLGPHGTEGGWHGAGWRSFVKLRCTNPNLYMCVIRCNCGIGIIRPGKQKIYDAAPVEECLTWEYFHKHRVALLNGFSPNMMDKVL